MTSRRYPHWTGECGFQTNLGQSIPNLGDDGIWPAQDVSAREAQQPDIRQEQAIFATIVLDEACSMRFAVLFEMQPVLAIVEVWASEKGTSFVPDRHLDLGTRQPI